MNRPPLRDQSQGVGGSSASFGEGELALAERNPMDVALCSPPERGKALIQALPKALPDDIDSIANVVTSKYPNLHETATSNSIDSSGNTSSVFSKTLTKVWIVSSQETLERLFQSASNNR
ncbi:hypothetical protein OVV68_04855 [Pseudomonas aeruginosa]|uniref:hypothetical protein n=1 Tax=Pseudomonas aeruginosa TaxID=287 RepID=UPI0018DF620B|nr:hypothetical protein [Pseudomonas aeruginosa]MBI7025870.1 hypothetical protein [Pseudomonas aeruginosa]MBI9168384.1 hypothetical protein [Pseudomonas aeruginosa]MCY0310585.1 hypothetical protein [Pseudomonas aeruginosa]MCY0512537.1 hypothetical protein [Pseudomonas aeruginosa]QPZ72548.1 hypothetical protein I9X29_02915 [Pseudomonas aeruginosa]